MSRVMPLWARAMLSTLFAVSVLTACTVSVEGGLIGTLTTLLVGVALFFGVGVTQSGCIEDNRLPDPDEIDAQVGPCLAPLLEDAQISMGDGSVGPCLGALLEDARVPDAIIGPCLSQVEADIGPCLDIAAEDIGIGPCLEPPFDDVGVGPCLDVPAPDAEIGPCLGAPLEDVGVGPCLDVPPPDAEVGPCLSPPPPDDGSGRVESVPGDPLDPRPHSRAEIIAKVISSGQLPPDVAARLRGGGEDKG